VGATWAISPDYHGNIGGLKYLADALEPGGSTGMAVLGHGVAVQRACVRLDSHILPPYGDL
jgi:hypothetical protein